MSNIDEVHLQNEVLAAAQAAIANDQETARTHLRQCFDVLIEARERFYPVNAYLIDLTLVAPTTLGQSLRDELASDVPKNLLMAGSVLEQLAESEPETLAALRLALDHKRVDIVGGGYLESELPLLPVEALLADLQHAQEVHRRLLGQTPTVFGRRRFGLSPVLPQLLSRLGYVGALHVTLDDGRFPQSDQAKIRWEGWDSSIMPALGRTPLDAALAESVLGFSRKMGDSMDTDHVATVVFAHWPGAASPFYRDLGRMATYGAALGKFVTLADYFANTDAPHEPSRFKADQYRSPYLRQAVIRQQTDPISAHIREHSHWLSQAGVHTLESFGELLGGGRVDSVSDDPAAGEALGANTSALAGEELHRRRETAGRRFAQAASASSATPPTGCLVLNPASFTRRALVDVSSLASPPATTGPVVGVQELAGRRQALVEVPPCGFVWLQAGGGALRTAKQPLAEGNVLRTEFFELIIHPETGGIRSVLVPGKRGNRISQQLALRLPAPRPEPGALWRDPEETAQYSTMLAESIEVTQSGTLSGQIISRGRLVDGQQNRLAGFKQTFQVQRGSRVIGLEIELDIAEQPRADAWGSYYAARFAWADAAAELWRSVSLTAQPSGSKRIEAPHFFEIRSENARTAILTGGLPYHLFNGDRMLDSLLVVRGESAQRFRLGISIDAAHPAADALDLIDPPLMLPSAPLPGTGSGSGWLFHLDARNVVATHWNVIRESTKPVGFRVRLLETEGRSDRVKLRSFRAPSVARQVDFNGQTQVELGVKDDTITIELGRYEWVEVEARWQ